MVGLKERHASGTEKQNWSTVQLRVKECECAHELIAFQVGAQEWFDRTVIAIYRTLLMPRWRNW